MNGRFCLILAAVFVFHSLSWAVDSPFAAQYSGEQVMRENGREIVNQVYVDNGKTRVETSGESGKTVLIVRPDKKIVYNLLPKQKIAIANPIRPEDEKMIATYEKSAKRELVGTEMINGEEHDKYKLTMAKKTSILWVNKTTHFPTQLESEDGTLHVEWRKVTLGPPDPKLFEIPSGYKVIQTDQSVSVERP